MTTAAAVRLALSIHHYRRPWNWTDDLVAEALVRLARWRAAGEGDATLDEGRAALDDDLDVPTAVTAVDAAAAAHVVRPDAEHRVGAPAD